MDLLIFKKEFIRQKTIVHNRRTMGRLAMSYRIKHKFVSITACLFISVHSVAIWKFSLSIDFLLLGPFFLPCFGDLKVSFYLLCMIIMRSPFDFHNKKQQMGIRIFLSLGIFYWKYWFIRIYFSKTNLVSSNSC